MDTIPFLDFGGAAVYDLEQRQTLSEILVAAKEQERYSAAATNYFSLIDGLELPNEVTHLVLSKGISASDDDSYLYLGGTYPPQFVCFELSNFCEKIRQHTNYNLVTMCAFPSSSEFSRSEDRLKVACVYVNRYIDFFAKSGRHERIRAPRLVRSAMYHPDSADLLLAGNGSKVWRFNLELGQFLPPHDLLGRSKKGSSTKDGEASDSDSDDAKNDEYENVVFGEMNPLHRLFMFGCVDGNVRFVDPRTRGVCGWTSARAHIGKQSTIRRRAVGIFGRSISVVPTQGAFDVDGVSFGVGMSSGEVGLFDLRKDGVIRIKDHHNDSPVTSLTFTDRSKSSSRHSYVVSSDRYCIKIWSKDTGSNLTNVETPGRINDVLLYPGSGMIFAAQQRERVTPYYVPKLGPTPRWCSFLQSFIGERLQQDLDEKSSSSNTTSSKPFVSYETKFVSVDELKQLGLEDLIGTKMLKPHLHGYMMRLDLYKKALRLMGDDGQGTKIHERDVRQMKKDDEEMDDDEASVPSAAASGERKGRGRGRGKGRGRRGKGKKRKKGKPSEPRWLRQGKRSRSAIADWDDMSRIRKKKKRR